MEFYNESNIKLYPLLACAICRACVCAVPFQLCD
jgi:hypothetical protein